VPLHRAARAVALAALPALALAEGGGSNPGFARAAHARGKAIEQKACNRGDGAACDRLGNIYLDAHYGGHPGDDDLGTALDRFRKACSLDSTDGCVDVAWIYMETMDHRAAVPILEHACDAGNVRGCGLLASLYAGDGADANLPRAYELLTRVCSGAELSDIGCQADCFELARWYYYGEPRLHLAKDHAKAAIFEQRSCDVGCFNSCHQMGDDYRDGDGVPRDGAKAAPLYQRACDAGFSPSCLELGKLFLVGAGVERNRDKASRLFDRACRTSGGQVDICRGDATGRKLRQVLDGCDKPARDARACDELFGVRDGK
jgi:TPR repeat protein